MTMEELHSITLARMIITACSRLIEEHEKDKPNSNYIALLNMIHEDNIGQYTYFYKYEETVR